MQNACFTIKESDSTLSRTCVLVAYIQCDIACKVAELANIYSFLSFCAFNDREFVFSPFYDEFYFVGHKKVAFGDVSNEVAKIAFFGINTKKNNLFLKKKQNFFGNVPYLSFIKTSSVCKCSKTMV
jgi:hypothetical protein